MNDLLIVIPAIKKNASIPDQLVKKLNGITLIQRAIITTLEIVSKENILIVTDSEEISLIAERNEINFFYDNKLSLNSENILNICFEIVKNINKNHIFIYRANTPLINSNTLIDAYNKFKKDDKKILISAKAENKIILEENSYSINNQNIIEEIKAFLIFSKKHIFQREYYPYIIENSKSIEIKDYQDWWVCEKVLQRKRIIFNVIGNTEIGMGHIYRCLTLAHEITDHEIIFICEEQFKIVLKQIASTDYKVMTSFNILELLKELKPNMVINDTLNTNLDFITHLKKQNIKVINFEDLGEGSAIADLVINELFDTPQRKGNNYLWGYKYLTLRNEFDEAKPHIFEENLNSIMITFGGTDQNNLTLVSLKSILSICENNNIKIYIVCGGGYLYKNELKKFINKITYKNIELTFSSGVISKIMEKTQIALTSNGRTVYELCHMNIPSIVISHHKRESTHTFANFENGFINLGVYNYSTKKKIKENFEKLICNVEYRKLLYFNTKKYNFKENKLNVVKKILELL